MENRFNKIITIILVVIITIAAIIILYNNLLKNKNEKEIINGENEIVLQILYNDTFKKYTLEQLQDLESLTGLGGYITQNNITKGPYELTGVNIITLLNQYNIQSEYYSINVKAKDGYSMIFNLSYINGNVPVFNELGEQIKTGGATMIINYKENGEYLDKSIGPLRLAFICEDGFTSSKIWIKQINSILIIDD